MAREHILIRSFKYGRAKGKGAGTDRYPMIWLDDPIYGSASERLNALVWTVNVDILGIPDSDADVARVQAEAFITGLSIPERSKAVHRQTGISISGFTFTSLSDYYDDNAAGMRFTYTLTQANPVDLCAIYYDPTKQFDLPSALPVFPTDNPEGCAVFTDHVGLPNFSTKV